MNQKEYLAQFSRNCRIPFNEDLFMRSEDEIIEELKKVIISCQRHNKYFKIEVKGFTVVDDYAEVQNVLFKYYENANKNKSKAKKKDNPYAYINLNESDIKLLMVDYHIETPFAVDPIERQDDFRVIIAVPRIIDKYYFRINGIMRSTLYQIVDGSTYNNSNSSARIPNITFKIVFMAVRVFRYYLDVPLVDGTMLKLTHYMSNIFNKTTSASMYILAKFGLYGAIDFMGFDGIGLSITQTPITDPNYYSIRKDDNIWINAPRYLVDNNKVLQSFIACIYGCIVPGMNYETIFDNHFWTSSLGCQFNSLGKEATLNAMNPKENSYNTTFEKGLSILDSFETIYDISTKESIRLPEEDKATMYHIIRWLMREFNNLVAKDNLDVSIKKIRFSEYIASIYAMKIARGIYRVADLNSKITSSSIKRAIRTDPMYLVNMIAKSNLVSYRNMVSDMDSMLALKFTYKGIAGLGESNNNSIPDIVRYIHPSHIGRLDLDSSSDSNPGVTGTINPFTKIYDGYFSDYQEPNFWQAKFDQTLDEYRKLSGVKQAIEFKKQVLGITNEEQETVVDESLAAMKQLINPYWYANTGEVWQPIIFEEVEIDARHDI